MSRSNGSEIRIGHATGDDLYHRFRQVKGLLDQLQTRKQNLAYLLFDDGIHGNSAIMRTMPASSQGKKNTPDNLVLPAAPSKAKAPGTTKKQKTKQPLATGGKAVGRKVAEVKDQKNERL